MNRGFALMDSLPLCELENHQNSRGSRRVGKHEFRDWIRKGRCFMKRDASSTGAYRDDVSGEQREMLEAIRKVIFEVAPGIDEVIEYGMLGYPGLANLAAQKHYVALYVKPEVLAAHRDSLPGIDCGKSCIRFRRIDQVDAGVLRSLLSDVRRARGESE